MNDRNNTIAGWVLFAAAFALGSSLVAKEIFHSERPEEMGYPIEGVVEEGGAGEAAQPIEFYLAKADVAKGAQVFNKCAACHTVTNGGPNGLGPNLWGVIGEPIGQGRGFAFSDALAKKGGTWTWNAMSDWLKSPRAFAPGTKMTFAGISNDQDRANVIAYLNSQSSSPLPLPAAPAAKPEAPADGGEAGAQGNDAAPADGDGAAAESGNEATAAEPKPAG